LDASPSFVGLRILVVDDDTDWAEVCTILLRDAGASVITASRVDEALAALRRTAVDVVVADILLPEEDGFRLLRRIKASREIVAPHVIALTGLAFTSDHDEIVAAGFELHQTKPVDAKQLILAVRMCADGQAHIIAASRKKIA
jgi:CheY-like chemotaxis protein